MTQGLRGVQDEGLLCFFFFLVLQEACEILVPRTKGTEPVPLQWKCGFLTPRLPGNSLLHLS